MRERALVIENKGNEAKVEILRSSACDHCGACSIGTEKKPLFVWAKNSARAKAGQVVEVEMQAATMLSAAFIVYVIPLVTFLAGIALGYTGANALAIKDVETFALFSGLIFMGISFLGIHIYSKKAEKTRKYFSDIVSILKG